MTPFYCDRNKLWNHQVQLNNTLLNFSFGQIRSKNVQVPWQGLMSMFLEIVSLLCEITYLKYCIWLIPNKLLIQLLIIFDSMDTSIESIYYPPSNYKPSHKSNPINLKDRRINLRYLRLKWWNKWDRQHPDQQLYAVVCTKRKTNIYTYYIHCKNERDSNAKKTQQRQQQQQQKQCLFLWWSIFQRYNDRRYVPCTDSKAYEAKFFKRLTNSSITVHDLT